MQQHTPKEILIEAQRLLREVGWITGMMARTAEGTRLLLDSYKHDASMFEQKPVCFCAAGAIAYVGKYHSLKEFKEAEATAIFAEAILGDGTVPSERYRIIYGFNDTASHFDGLPRVLAKFDEAIALASQTEEAGLSKAFNSEHTPNDSEV